MIWIARRTSWVSVGWFVVASLPSLVMAQGNTFNPYGNSGYADYREFATPMYSNNPALPGQARLQSQPLGERQSASNQFEQYFSGIQEPIASGKRAGAARGIAAPGTPYYRTYRRFDEQYNRVYTPNNTRADRDFNARLKQRDERYADALKQTDPAIRARLLRQISDDPLTTSKPATAARPGTNPAAAPSAKAQAKPKSSPTRSTSPPSPSTTSDSPSRSAAGTVPYPSGFNAPAVVSPSRPKAKQARPNTTPAPAVPAATDEPDAL